MLREYLLNSVGPILALFPFIPTFGGKPKIKLTYTAFRSNNGAAASPISHTAVPIGADVPGRYVVLVISESTTSITSLTVGGISCTRKVYATGSRYISIWVSDTAVTGTTATITMTCSTSMDNEVAVYSLVDALTPGTLYTSATDSSDPLSQGVGVPAGGCILAGAIADNGGSCTWTGVEKDVDGTTANYDSSFGSLGPPDNVVSAEGSRTITANFTTAEYSMAIAVWAPK
jgi:hypothetical protein